MISSILDYQYVTGDTGNILVNGEIMPLRTGISETTGVARANILRGEDIIFLMESALTAKNLLSSSVSTASFSRKVSRYQVVGVRSLLVDCLACDLLKDGFDFQDATMVSTSDWFSTLLSGHTYTDIQMPNAGDDILRSDIESAFSDTKRLVRQCDVLDVSSFALTPQYSGLNVNNDPRGGGEITNPAPDYYTLLSNTFGHVCWNWKNLTSYGLFDSYITLDSDIEVFSRSSSRIGSAELWGLFSYEGWFATDEEGSTTTVGPARIIFKLDSCEGPNVSLTLKSSVVQEAVDRIISLTGYNVTTIEGNLMDELKVSLVDMAIVATQDDTMKWWTD